MTITKEERAALERLRRIYPTGKEKHREVYGRDGAGGRFDEERDRADISLALLREHPADEDELITEEWLRSVGFTTYGVFHDGWCGHEGGLQIGFKATGDGIDFHCMRTWRINERTIANCPKTRGQLRSLAAVLGIELREGK